MHIPHKKARIHFITADMCAARSSVMGQRSRQKKKIVLAVSCLRLECSPRYILNSTHKYFISILIFMKTTIYLKKIQTLGTQYTIYGILP